MMSGLISPVEWNVYVYKHNLITLCKILKKEGRAFRNIGNKKIYIFPTVKSALLLLFNVFLLTAE